MADPNREILGLLSAFEQGFIQTHLVVNSPPKLLKSPSKNFWPGRSVYSSIKK